MSSIRRRTLVLAYHSLDNSGSPLSIAPALFRWQMEFLQGNGWRTLTLDEFLAGYKRGSWPSRSFLLTFDDGFANIAEHALPVLSNLGYTGIIFVVANWVGRTNDWPGQPSWVPRQALLDWQSLRTATYEGMEIGCHTCSHPRLTRLASPAVQREIISGKHVIEAGIGRPVRAFAYPYGDASDTCRDAVTAHYRAGFGTRLGFASGTSHFASFERVDVYYLRRPWIFRKIEAPSFPAYLYARQWIRDLRQNRSSQ